MGIPPFPHWKERHLLSNERGYIITTDTNADLPDYYLSQHGIPVIPLYYEIDGERHACNDPALPPKEFYARMRAGSMPVTQQINPKEAAEIFEGIVESGMDILHLAFSSAMSGSYNAARLAADEVMERHPEARIIVIDTLSASLGLGLLIHHTLEKQEQGLTLDKAAEWVEQNKLHVCHVFTVDDLNHLYRGGRVSKTAAVFGTMLGIKPVMHTSNEGTLTPTGKVRGRKQSLLALVDNMGKQMGDWENDTCFICHSDCLEEAQFVADNVRERYKVKNFLIDYIGPTIGAHTGPGTIGLFFMGEVR